MAKAMKVGTQGKLMAKFAYLSGCIILQKGKNIWKEHGVISYSTKLNYLTAIVFFSFLAKTNFIELWNFS